MINLLKHLLEIKSWKDFCGQYSVHRQLVIVNLSYEDAEHCFLNLGLDKNNTLFFSQDHNCQHRLVGLNLQCISPKQFRHYLGVNTPNIIYDASFGVDLNALYGISGQVLAPGFVVIWFNTDQIGKASIDAVPTSFGFDTKVDNTKTLLLKYAGVETAIINSTTCYLPRKMEVQEFKVSSVEIGKPINVGGSSNLSANQNSTSIDLVIDSIPFNTAPSLCNRSELSRLEHAVLNHFKINVSEEQRKIISDIAEQLHFFRTTENTDCDISKVHCILGERGRGKSTTLAMLLFMAVLENDNQKNIVVTGLHRQNLGQVRDIFNGLKTVFSNEKNLIREFDVPFSPPDSILKKEYNIDVLFIDEVASLAPDLLKALISRSNFVVVSGTTSGYEGSGKGFTTRLLPFLEERELVRCYYLNRPFRWQNNDPVEQLFDTLLAHKPLRKSQTICNIQYSQLNFSQVNQTDILNDKVLYQEIVSLLFEAHYQTSPNDIVRILNAPESKIFVASHNQSVIAVITVFIEGSNALKPYAEAIKLNKRRVQGHLSAQGLSSAIVEANLACLNYWRINRIAVHKQLRRQGIGSFMLKSLFKAAQQKAIDAVTSSFGFQPQLFNFWTTNNFELVKLGKRIDTSSGSASVIVIKPIKSASLSYLKPLQNTVSIELEYLQHYYPRLGEVYETLNNYKFKDGETEKAALVSFAKQTCSNWLKADILKHIDFDKLVHFLFFISRYGVDDHINLQDEFAELSNGGMHKYQRNRLQTKIIDQIYPFLLAK